MRTLVLVPALFLIAAVSGEGAERARIELSRAPRPPVIDGLLDDEAWQSPLLALSEWITYNPLNGEQLPQRTDVHATYDDRYIYFAFHCLDPEPDKVRSTMSRRDQMWNDDWVGLSLDSVGNGQSSYDMFVNPAGVQGDILTTPSAGENSAPDWVWDSAGRRTDQGYDVEMRLPLTSIRFVSGAEVHMGVLFWRRVSRLQELGVVKNRVAVLDREKVGLNVLVFSRVKLSGHGRDALLKFEQAVREHPEILECYTMMGETDFLLRIVCRDIKAYEAFFLDHLSRFPGVQEVNSSIAMAVVKETTALPLATTQHHNAA